jgi:hypothetical protein
LPLSQARQFRRRDNGLGENGGRLPSLARLINCVGGTRDRLSTSDIKYPAVKSADGALIALASGGCAAPLEGSISRTDRAKPARMRARLVATGF